MNGDPDAEQFCTFVMKLRYNENSRRTRTLTKLRSDLGRPRCRWIGPLKMQMWSLFACLRILVVPDFPVPSDPALDTITKEQRVALQGTGLVRPRKENRKKLSALMCAQVKTSTHNSDVVVWMDNFNKKRFSRNPNENRDKCINGTVFAVMALPFLHMSPAPSPPIKTLLATVNDMVSYMTRAVPFVNRLARDVVQEGLTFGKVRAPLDVRRENVTPPPWLPADLHAYNVGSAEGLLRGLQHIRATFSPSARSVTIMCDVNLFYRAMRMMYSSAYAQFNFRAWLAKTPLVLGVWHSYKYCVQQFYASFLPLITCLEYGTLYTDNPESASIGNSPKLILMERVILGIFLNAKHGEEVIDARLAALKRALTNKWASPEEKQVITDKVNHMLALRTMVVDYVPLLFFIGRAVRDCHWAERNIGSGLSAKNIHLYCLVVLLQLRRRAKGRQEYICALTWQLLV